MDIDPDDLTPKPNERHPKGEKSPKREKGTGNSPSPERELDPKRQRALDIVTGAATGIIQNRSKLDMLSFLIQECEISELDRSPEDSSQRRNIEPNTVERFLLSKNESPLIETEEAQAYLSNLETPVTSIDETDPSNKTLFDYLSEEQKLEVQRLKEALLPEKNVATRIQDIFRQNSPDLLEAFEETQEVTAPLSKEQNIFLILGKDQNEEDRKELEESLNELDDQNRISGFLAAERARLLCQSMTLTPEEGGTKAKDYAKELLGEETYSLIEKQTEFLNNSINEAYANDTHPPDTAEALICPEILARMGEDGPSEDQLATLAKVRDFYLFRRDQGTPTPQEEKYQTSRLALASLYTIEYGKWAENANILKEYRQILKSKDKNIDPLLKHDKEPQGPTAEEDKGQQPPPPPKKETKDSTEKQPNSKKDSKKSDMLRKLGHGSLQYGKFHSGRFGSWLYHKTKRELTHDDGDEFGANKGIRQAFKEMGMDAIDK